MNSYGRYIYDIAEEFMKRIPTVHMIHGYLGAGKTTFAQKLERELPGIRFTQDEWVTCIFGNRHLDPEKMLKPVRDLIDSCWTRCVELGLDVILDNGFWSSKDRDEIRAKAANLWCGLSPVLPFSA